MRSVSKTMYTIGKIINIIEIVFAILFIVLGANEAIEADIE